MSLFIASTNILQNSRRITIGFQYFTSSFQKYENVNSWSTNQIAHIFVC